MIFSLVFGPSFAPIALVMKWKILIFFLIQVQAEAAAPRICSDSNLRLQILDRQIRFIEGGLTKLEEIKGIANEATIEETYQEIKKDIKVVQSLIDEKPRCLDIEFQLSRSERKMKAWNEQLESKYKVAKEDVLRFCAHQVKWLSEQEPILENTDHWLTKKVMARKLMNEAEQLIKDERCLSVDREWLSLFRDQMFEEVYHQRLPASQSSR